jgi:putative phosphoesterase
MKLGLLGDIHANAAALEVILASARLQGIDHLLVTGDLVGYYFEPAKVLDLLSGWRRHVVRGNHEDMLRRLRSDDSQAEVIAGRYGSGLQLALAQLDHVGLEALDGLPAFLECELDGCRILLCHGAPWSVDQYVYPDAADEVLEHCAASGVDFVVMGHTHYPMLKRVGDTTIVNPGSAGQPRNGRPGAQWAVLDTQSRHIEFRAESYATDTLVAQCRTLHPELPYLADILERRR